MVVWLRPEYILAFITSLYYCSQFVVSKTYDKFWCSTEEGIHQLSCPDETALLTDITIRKVYRRTQMCQPDEHSEYLIQCQSFIDSSLCEGNKTCTISISSRDYLQCGDKIYPPTYFFVKYTCTQIHTMCTDTSPIRNTLNGYIISPAYPHPMADNLKCSISIEADPSMYIEISPIQIQLQEAFNCRSEYLQIFGYNSSDNQNNHYENNEWKAYHTWCGTEQSLHTPLINARYLIPSNCIYIALQTSVSKRARYFKIRYRMIPSTARSHYNSDGIIIDSVAVKGQESFDISSTAIIATTMIIPSLNNNDIKNVNGTVGPKRWKKKTLILIISGGVGLLLFLIAIIIGVVIFICLRRRRSSSNTKKKSTPPATSTTTSKSTAKSSDKAPLLEQPTNTSTAAAAAAAATKRKLVPERTVQISDVSTSRFKPEASGTKPENPLTTKPTFSAADSGIYGADIIEETTAVTKPLLSPINEQAKTNEIDLIDQSESVPSPPPPIVTDALPSEPSTNTPIVHSDNIEKTPEKEILFDDTIQSAYPNLIDATTSENEGTICGSSMHSRRTSTRKSSASIIHETVNIETIVLTDQIDPISTAASQHIIPFNPLHVILKKDANKYYTTEYI